MLAKYNDGKKKKLLIRFDGFVSFDQISKCLYIAVIYVMIDCQSGLSEEASSSMSSEVGMPTDSDARKATWKLCRTSEELRDSNGTCCGK